MKRPVRVALIAACGVLLVVLIVAITGVLIVRSQWFHDKVRNRIVSEVERATGGRVEIASFDFEWKVLTATVRGFTIHGSEPPAGPPLLHADDVVVGLKIISVLKRDVDISLLRVDQPRAFLLIGADGTTNIPNPKSPSKSTKTGMETIVDLAIQRFELNNGGAEIRAQNAAPKLTELYSAQAGNVRALFTYDSAVPRYHGDLSLQPLNLAYGNIKPLPAAITTTLAFEQNRIIIEKAALISGGSEIHVNGRMENFNAPVITAEYGAKISVAEAGSILRLTSRQSGTLEATGSASYKSSSDYALSGILKAYNIDYRTGAMSLHNLRAEAKLDGGPKSISINYIRAYGLGGEVEAKGEIAAFDRFKLNAQLKHFDVLRLSELAVRQKLPYDGVISGPLMAEGRFSELSSNRVKVTTRLTVSPSGNGLPVHGMIDAKFNGAGDTLDLGNSFLALPYTRLDFQGTLGKQLNIRLASTNLNDLLPALRSAAKAGQPAPAIPVSFQPQGSLVFDGTVTGKLASPLLTGHLGGSNFVVEDQVIDALDADVTAASTGATVARGALRQHGVTANFAASVGLHNWSPEPDQPLTAALGLQHASLPDLLALAGQKGVPATGTLTVNAKVSGTVGNPQATADLTLTKGTLSQEPFDRLTARIDAPNRATQTATAQLIAGPKQVNLKASYGHSVSDFLAGRLTFEIQSNTIAFNQVVTLRQREPELNGTAQLTARGILDIRRDPSGKPALQISRVNADVTANRLQLQGKPLGDLHLTADTTAAAGAPSLNVRLRSNLAHANIEGDGHWALLGDYEGTATLKFSNVNLETVRRLALPPEKADSVPLGGSIEGSLAISGPAAKPDQLRATLEIPKLELLPQTSQVGAVGAVDLTVRNSGPIRISLANNVVKVESARLVAQDSNFTLSGQVALLPPRKADLHVDGSVNLSIVHLFNTDIVSSGGLQINAGVRGSLDNPSLNGTVLLKNANVAIVDVPNGLSNANGTIAFSGNQARIEELTAESGGGKVRISGFASLAGGSPSFRISANADGVRVRYPEGVSTVADAQLRLVGTAERSVLSGTVTVNRLAFNPKTDLGSVLSSTSAPPETSSAPSGFAGGLSYDVEIQTSPDISFESGLTQGVEADANLRLRGNLANPVLLGRINITQGDLLFFGNKYSINQGSVSFYNPVKMEPILNVDLETVARGVDVTLTVSGPITKLNVSYRSDPPLQFSDIVALLATGRSPNDATIAARQPTAPAQSWQQMGASALVGQAIANPVAGRLQRFFGVSKIKIDPIISGATGNPQAKVTLEQQITPDITFTYITDVANAQEQIIRVEWALSPTWSAVALRDQNGEFGIDFLYKKRFR